MNEAQNNFVLKTETVIIFIQTYVALQINVFLALKPIRIRPTGKDPDVGKLFY